MMTDLEAFHLGFADGWIGATRKTNMGGTYLRAYRSGRAAKERYENGGEDTGHAPRRQKRAA